MAHYLYKPAEEEKEAEAGLDGLSSVERETLEGLSKTDKLKYREIYIKMVI